jgi:cell division protein FtsI (penicillin-binding protein 3)
MSSGTGTHRLVIAAAPLALMLSGLGFRLASLHLGNHDKFRAEIEENRRIEEQILAGRGHIYDRGGSGNILALNLAVKDVCADPQMIVSNDCLAEVATQLADALDLATDEVAVRLNRPERRYACVKRAVREESVEVVRKQELPGVFFRDKIVRYYPQENFMCHVLGFVNHNGDASGGVEQYLDEYLRGCPGMRLSRVNAFRQKVFWDEERDIPAIEGADVSLNVDQNIQYFVEKALDEVMIKHKAKGAWSIVQCVRTGRILAMAARPGYDLNNFNEFGKSAWLNRAVGHVYEPGSTFKAVAFAAALNEGIVDPNEELHCEHGAWRYGKRTLRDFHPYGILTVADGLKKSSNILSAKVALRLGENRFYDYLGRFNIGRRMGVDLPGEEAGILHPVSGWSKISATRIAIGQGVAVTALQMLGVFCAIANDGVLMRPYIVQRVTDREGGTLVEPKSSVLQRPVRPETAALMRRLLLRVTEDGGTGKRARVEGYKVAGKTGTAQKPVNGRYSDTAYMASFVGFLPAEDPRIAAIVVVDEPQPKHTGGYVAGPAFSRIAGQTVRYLNIPPDGYRVAQQRVNRVGIR